MTAIIVCQNVIFTPKLMSNITEGFIFDLSIVIPVFNSAASLEPLVEKIESSLNPANYSFEVIFVDDCSEDDSSSSLNSILKKHHNITVIELRKNFGQDNAIMAGLEHSSGAKIVIMDDDLQHNPSDIISLHKNLTHDVDVCYANFVTKKQEWFKNLGSNFNHFCANILLNKPKEIYLSPFKILDAGIKEEILKYKGPYPYVDGLIFRSTLRVKQIEVEHSVRFSGRGNYTLLKSIKVWLKLVTNFSILPLRLATLSGFTFAGIGFIFAIIFIINYFYGSQAPQGWSSVAVLILCFGGIQLIAIGMIGEYLGRLFLLNNNQPQYIVRNIRTNK
ncbi:MAG TPA: glycosyl transferase family 2 [Methylophilaceae bacterium]|nr:glycosyl transferase family 2 [Methylophilaceae bacterium]